MSKRVGYFVHDVLAHPLCGLLWIVGARLAGDWLHDLTVFASNVDDERWPSG